MGIPRISPQEAKALMDEQGYVYLDVRSVPEFQAGHPTGAYNIPLLHAGPSGRQPNADFTKVVSAAFSKVAKLVVGCNSGGRSKRACDLLSADGFANVVDQCAGFAGTRDAFGGVAMPGWQTESLPMAIHAEEGRSYAE